MPTDSSSHRAAGTKFTDSALRRMTRPPYVQRIRVCWSVMASTRSPSSAVRRSSASTRSTARCSGESCQNARASDSSSSGASATSRETRGRDRRQLRRISGRTSDSAPSPSSTNAFHARSALSAPVLQVGRAHRVSPVCEVRADAVTVAPPWSALTRGGCARRRWASRLPDPPHRPAMISAAMQIAVSSGVRAPRSRPIGLDRRFSSSSVTPASRSRSSRSSWVRRDPMAPT